jgi:hypothetical protein
MVQGYIKRRHSVWQSLEFCHLLSFRILTLYTHRYQHGLVRRRPQTRSGLQHRMLLLLQRVLQTLITVISQYQSAPKHESHVSHELIAGAAAYEVRLRIPVVVLSH